MFGGNDNIKLNSKGYLDVAEIREKNKYRWLFKESETLIFITCNDLPPLRLSFTQNKYLNSIECVLKNYIVTQVRKPSL